MQLTGLRLLGKLENIQEQEYKCKKTGNDKVSYKLWIAIEGGKQSISSQTKPELNEGEYYSFPVGTNSYEYVNKEDGEIKKATSLYLKKGHIESL